MTVLLSRVAIPTLFVLFFCVFFVGQVQPTFGNENKTVHEDDQVASETKVLPESTRDLIFEVSNLVMERHISPPTRQEMILTAIKGIYFAFYARPPKTLPEEVSKCVNQDQYAALMNRHWKNCPKSGKETVEQVNNRVLSAMIKSFDPRGRLIGAKALRVEKQLSENRYVGIGIRLAQEGGKSVITDPIVGGTARKAGSKPGDVILEIDGKTTDGMDLREVVDKLRGELGTRVVVKVKNKNSGETRVMDMIRAKIPIPTVQAPRRNKDDSWDYAITPGKKLALLSFDRIVGSTAAEVRTMAEELDEQGFEHIVLDLRVSNDIDFHHALMLADTLSGQHRLGSFEKTKQTKRELTKRELTTRDDCCFADKKLYVITNQNVVGAELAVIVALKKAGATFVGRPIVSDMKVGERVELGNQRGAIANVSTGFFAPAGVKQNKMSIGQDYYADLEARGLIVLQPDFATEHASALAKCRELFEKNSSE